MWCIARCLKFAVLAVLAGLALGGAVMLLWNALMPELFGWRALSYLQAIGLLALARLLFGRLGGRCHGHGGWRRHMQERWEQMTPEEREKFRAGMKCGWSCGDEKDEKSPEPPKA